jgi:uncharacterized membrane protein YbhN (UPF0104 family)
VPPTPAVLRRIARSPLLRVAGTVAGMVLLARCVDLRSAAITLSGANRLWLAAGVTLAAAAWAAALCAAPAVRRMGGHRRRTVRRLAGLLHPLTEAMSWYRGRGGVVGASLAAGAAGWGLHLLSLQALGRAVGIDVSPAIFALLVPVALLATLLPVTVNGMGVREGVLVALLARYGVDAHRAAVLAVLADLQALPIALVGAALWFSRRS